MSSVTRASRSRRDRDAGTTILERGLTVVLLVGSGAVFALVGLLAAAHVADRFGVGPASGVWMGLAAAAKAGVWYPPPYAHGFFGGTRYMPLPIVLELAGHFVGGGYLVSTKVLVYTTNAALYALTYVLARRRGAPTAIALALVGAVLASSAAETTTLGIRWDSLATLLQLLAVSIVVAGTTRGRTLAAGSLCALALTTKVSALWAPAAIGVWLLRRNPRRFAEFSGALVVVGAAILTPFELLSDGRLLRQIREFTFAATANMPATEGLQRIYELVLRNQRSLPLLLLVAAVAVLLAVARRRIGPYELGLVFVVPILVVAMRDPGVYENHLIDLEVLSALVVAGLWEAPTQRLSSRVRELAVAFCVVVAAAAAARYTLVPDARAALRNELHGRADPRYAVHPLPHVVSKGTCALFEDATLPLLAGQRPLVLDAFILHRLQTHDPPAIRALIGRIRRGAFASIVLDRPVTDLGWFATVDFGTATAEAIRADYLLSRSLPADGLYVYTPRRRPASRACGVVRLSEWR